ncbi:MAG TPA: PQQ-binding-like beta-propeller repeat protein [Steroidobacteraceae bacterium]|nr:PQQ-binding-like beta-propeller repeat protein [Steroidobacteraceae bacterium]
MKNAEIGAVLSSPVIERDVIYFGSTDGSVYAIS